MTLSSRAKRGICTWLARWRFLALLGMTVVACGDATAPLTQSDYQLESIGGRPLPLTLLTDYDVKVSVESDVISLRSDSTFLEVARFHGTSSDVELVTVDSISGTYSVSGSTLFLLLSSGRATRMTYDGVTLTQNFGDGVLVYRRRSYLDAPAGAGSVLRSRD